MVGVGPNAADWRNNCASSVMVPWEVLQDPDVRHHVRVAHVVVAAGMVAMEAAQMRRRVIVPCKVGGWQGAVTWESLQIMRDTNFVLWSAPTTRDTGEVWNIVCAVSDSELAKISQWVTEECSPTVMFQRLQAFGRPPGTSDPAESVAIVSEVLADAHRSRGQDP